MSLTLEAPHEASPAPAAPTRRWGPVAAILVVALVLAVCAGLLLRDRLSSPGNDSVDAGFARDMQMHHAQAVDMSYAVIVATEDPTVRAIALDILTTQQAQIGVMSEWLDAWDLPAYSSAPLMAWMEHGGHDGHDGHDAGMDGALMTGMATDADMEQLREATGQDAEILFLQLMVEHHRGGVDMADDAAANADVEDVRLLAERMAASQEVEIDAMNDLLVERGADPV